jgi:hypothetical protein
VYRARVTFKGQITIPREGNGDPGNQRRAIGSLSGGERPRDPEASEKKVPSGFLRRLSGNETVSRDGSGSKGAPQADGEETDQERIMTLA